MTMTQARALPIPADHREFTVKVDGAAVDRSHQLLATSVTAAANKISRARLIYLDGAASSSDFPLSNTGLFVPGKEVEILAGPSNNSISLFKGVVIRHSVKVRHQTAPQLVIECRHKAVRLAVGRTNAYFANQKDSDVISSLLQKASLSADVETTAVTHKQQVQYFCTDWDFLVTRAEANGQLVFTVDNKVVVKKPAKGGQPVCTLQFGSTVLEMDAEIDARNQYKAVQSVSWDPAQQSLLQKDGMDPNLRAPGNLTLSDLAAVAGLVQFRLQHVAVGEEEAQAWADSEWLRSQMSRVSGRAKCEGIATVHPGDTVTLAGVGDRFNGDVLVTGVRHECDMVQGWKTYVQFGSVDRRLADDKAPAASKASALLPGVNGLQIGVVVSNEDPEGEHRVRVRMPLVSDTDDGTWARVAVPDAGNNRGFFFRPEVSDEVILGFLNDDPRQAVILGMLHSSAKAAPLTGSNDNHEKIYQSRSGMKLHFNDDTKVIRLETPAGNKLTMSEDAKAITIEDQNGNKIEMSSNGITITSSKALELKAGTDLKLESTAALSAKGGSDLKLEGASSAEISSTAMTKVKGSLVQLN